MDFLEIHVFQSFQGSASQKENKILVINRGINLKSMANTQVCHHLNQWKNYHTLLRFCLGKGHCTLDIHRYLQICVKSSVEKYDCFDVDRFYSYLILQELELQLILNELINNDVHLSYLYLPLAH